LEKFGKKKSRPLQKIFFFFFHKQIMFRISFDTQNLQDVNRVLDALGTEERANRLQISVERTFNAAVNVRAADAPLAPAAAPPPVAPRGASRFLTARIWNAEQRSEQENTCPVCFDSVRSLDEFFVFACGHSGHKACLQQLASCPVCRA
jgi:hypothetical protein